MAQTTDDYDQIVVLRPHLEMILATLDRALSVNSATDLIEHYRGRAGSQPRPSNLTTTLSRSYDKVAGYLGVSDADELS